MKALLPVAWFLVQAHGAVITLQYPCSNSSIFFDTAGLQCTSCPANAVCAVIMLDTTTETVVSIGLCNCRQRRQMEMAADAVLDILMMLGTALQLCAALATAHHVLWCVNSGVVLRMVDVGVLARICPNAALPAIPPGATAGAGAICHRPVLRAMRQLEWHCHRQQWPACSRRLDK